MNLQQHTEHDGTTYRVGLAVKRVDWENDGTPAFRGVIERIERDNQEEITYWIRWEGTTAPDPHGPYAFQSLWHVDTDKGNGFTLREHILGGGRSEWSLYRGAFLKRYKTEKGALRRIERDLARESRPMTSVTLDKI